MLYLFAAIFTFPVLFVDARSLQPFFVEPHLPYAATRGELLPLTATAHNYAATAATVVITLSGATGLTIVGAAEATIIVAAGAVGAAAFRVRPTAIGVVEVTVTAAAALEGGGTHGDTVVRRLRVDPEGLPKELTYNAIVDLSAENCTAEAPCEQSFELVPALPMAARGGTEGMVGKYEGVCGGAESVDAHEGGEDGAGSGKRQIREHGRNSRLGQSSRAPIESSDRGAEGRGAASMPAKHVSAEESP